MKQMVSVGLRLLLLLLAAAVMEIGWLMVWTVSYRLTHGNGFTYAYLVTQNPIWEKLHDLLVLANTLAPGLEGPNGPETLDVIVNSLVFGFVLAGIGYLAAILLVDLGVSAVRGAVVLVVLVEIAFQVTLFLMPGVYTTDISSYVMYGHISAIYNLNPYVYPPQFFPNNPLLNPDWIHPIWWDQPSVYGPLWTDLGWLVARIMAPFADQTETMPDGLVLQIGLVDQIWAYRVLMNVVQIANVALIWWLLGRLMPNKPRARLTAFVLFAWNPLMLFDAAGNAHNDALMVTLLLLGIVPLVTRRTLTPTLSLKGEGALARDGALAVTSPSQGEVARSAGEGALGRNLMWLLGTFFVGMSALIKYTTALVGLFYIVPWARRLSTWRERCMWLAATAGLIVGVTFVLYIPWLDFPRAFAPILTAASGKSWMYSNWAPDLVAMTISDQWLDPNALNTEATHEMVHFWAKAITRGVFFVYLGWELVRLWRIAGDRSRSLVEPILETSARAFVVLILWVLTWVLEWYWMWPLALVSLLGWQRLLAKVVVGYTLTSLPIFYVHHYWSSNMPGILVLAYALPPLAVPLVAWSWNRYARRAKPAPRTQAVLAPGLGAATE